MTIWEIVFLTLLAVVATVLLVAVGAGLQHRQAEKAADRNCKVYGFQWGEFDIDRGYICYQSPTPLWPVETQREAGK